MEVEKPLLFVLSTNVFDGIFCSGTGGKQVKERLKKRVLVVFSPYGQNLFGFIFTDQRNKHKVIHLIQASDTGYRQDGNTLFGGDHHQYAFYIAGAQKYPGVIAGFLI